MLTEQVDWNELKDSFSYVASDSLAVVRPERNTLWFHPVFLNEATNDPFVKIEGAWMPVAELKNFERYQKINRKKLFNTSTLEVVEL